MSRGSQSSGKDPGLLYGSPLKRPRTRRAHRSEDADGRIVWRLTGKLHREDGPAVIDPQGHLEWWLEGLRHREDGAAVESEDGSREWWIQGEEFSVAEWAKRTGRNLGQPPTHEFMDDDRCLRCGVKIEEGGAGSIGCEAGPEGNDPAYVGFARTALEQDLEISLDEKMRGIIGEADDLSVREFRDKAQAWSEKVVRRAQQRVKDRKRG
jgi:hypothetical protein